MPREQLPSLVHAWLARQSEPLFGTHCVSPLAQLPSRRHALLLLQSTSLSTTQRPLGRSTPHSPRSPQPALARQSASLAAMQRANAGALPLSREQMPSAAQMELFRQWSAVPGVQIETCFPMNANLLSTHLPSFNGVWGSDANMMGHFKGSLFTNITLKPIEVERHCQCATRIKIHEQAGPGRSQRFIQGGNLDPRHWAKCLAVEEVTIGMPSTG